MAGLNESLQRNVAELRKGAFWKALLAEMIGTLVLVFVGCASCVESYKEEENGVYTYTPIPASMIQIALTFGIAVATAVWGIAHVSGGHINPAVTVAMFVTNKITFVRAVLYVGVQCVGAVFGALILKGVNTHITNSEVGLPLNKTMCLTGLSDPITAGQGFGIELIITFVLVFTVFASCDSHRRDLGGSIPLTIGLSVTLCHLFAIKYTGSSMNPARTFGPAAIVGDWCNHWVYWVGPICGGIIAGLLYEILFSVDASFEKISNMIKSEDPANAEGEDVENKRDYIVSGDRSTNRGECKL